jgi:nitrate/nitrite transporter NarK
MLWTFMTQPYTSVALGFAIAASWPLGRWLAPRRGRSRVIAALFALSAGLILALTLTPNEPGRYSPFPAHYLTQLSHPGRAWAALWALPDDREEYANIALYLPLGFLARHFLGSAAGAALCGMALTVFVETCQYGIVGRDGSLTDIRNNSLGTVLGVAAAVGAIRVAGPRIRADHRISGRRRRRGGAAPPGEQ